MEDLWAVDLVSQVLDILFSFWKEFLQDWDSNDMRGVIFKLLLGWLVLSLLVIHLAWKVYGSTVNDMYYRQGLVLSGSDQEQESLRGSPEIQLIGRQSEIMHDSMGGQNGGTPEAASHFTSWESVGSDPSKTHRE
ncbi:T-cell leukemia translocation-altered gene protein homolog isoform X1 [Latimeria chalumnae]|uniref:T-cell leukemia translocation-altered gene protein homolog isoform X1 n=1 Tax=Latimeria chalumnae TaxID=7897 RepID=UPI0003C15F61|nr:PREDICTED: T-cell leukemia translocation-altered gene protein [Latimeria chalumnae]|eukprot:XP_005992736.1 PREDICTED: T-cell leukemia translocation-altered gene protein [Latimeria chalumnae]